MSNVNPDSHNTTTRARPKHDNSQFRPSYNKQIYGMQANNSKSDVEDFIYKFHDCKTCTNFDMRRGYLQLEQDSTSQTVATFSTPWGNFGQKRLVLASQVLFYETMQRIFGGIVDKWIPSSNLNNTGSQALVSNEDPTDLFCPSPRLAHGRN
mgnify:FL=1